MLGSLVTGFLGDRYGRRFTYQANLAIFGFASLAAAFAPSMQVLILIQFVIGFGLGAENVVGYSTLTEFVPPQSRGKWLGLHDRLRRHRLAGRRAAGNAHHPEIRLARHVRAWRARRARRLVFAQKIAGIAALAGIGRTHRRGRGLVAGDRERSRAATFAAAAPPRLRRS